jgi:Zn ribbon nucleic-acid-binding protein
MVEAVKCLRCGGAMEEGFIPDRGHYGIETAPTTWVEGEPETSFWSGLNTDDRRRYIVIINRCVQCGWLEQYARERTY